MTSPRNPRTILLTEDERQVRDLVRVVLQTNGYTVISSTGIDDALSRAAEWEGEIDLLLTDMMMPGGSGSDLTKELLAKRPNLKVIFMSGYPDSADTGPLTANRCRFLQKPFTRDSLLRAVRDLLG